MKQSRSAKTNSALVTANEATGTYGIETSQLNQIWCQPQTPSSCYPLEVHLSFEDEMCGADGEAAQNVCWTDFEPIKRKPRRQDKRKEGWSPLYDSANHTGCIAISHIDSSFMLQDVLDWVVDFGNSLLAFLNLRNRRLQRVFGDKTMSSHLKGGMTILQLIQRQQCADSQRVQVVNTAE